MDNIKKFIWAWLLLLAAGQTDATLIADPDIIWTDPGTSHEIDNAFDGVTLSTNADNGHVLALGSGIEGVTDWYPAVFGHGLINFPSGGCSGCWSFGFAELRADFEALASSVSVEFIDRFAGSAIVEAYDSSGFLISRAESILDGNSAIEADIISLTIIDPTNSIAYILAGASIGTYGLIDRLTWNPVPEPSILALILSGILGLGFVRRRKLGSI